MHNSGPVVNKSEITVHVTTPSTIKQVKKVKKINLDLASVGLNEFNYKNKSSIVTYLVQHLNFCHFPDHFRSLFSEKNNKNQKFPIHPGKSTYSVLSNFNGVEKRH